MRIEQLTFTRFVAAFFIYVYHYGRKTYPFSIEQAVTFFKQTNAGVSYFFILSGYVMIFAYYKNFNERIDSKVFYINRFARIYPIYLIALILATIFKIYKLEVFRLLSIPFQLLGVQAWFAGYAMELNYPGWSISNELFFFLLFPLLFNKVYLKYNLFNVSVVVIGIWAITQIVFNFLFRSSYYEGWATISHEVLFYNPLMHINEFLIGNIAGLYFLQRIKGAGKQGNYDLVIVLLVLVLGLCMAFPIVNYHNGFLAIVFVPLLLLLSLNTGIITKIFAKPSLVLLGEISYGFYILHFPILTFCKFAYLKLGINKEQFPLFYVGFFVVLICSYLSYFIIEKPMRKWLSEILKRKFFSNTTINI